MTIWRPAQTIRVKTIGLPWRKGHLLAAEVPDDSGRTKGVRPLGGTVEFGETWQQALQREFQEELGVEITIIGAPVVLENIYQHEGQTGHEIIFAAQVTWPETPHLAGDTIEFFEDNGLKCIARWFHPDALEVGGTELFPTGLKAHLQDLGSPTRA
ncbi:NUDIX domain-containing protein [Phaeobacter sp. LSS9]|uniref:NUDIX hydrolase n=1 Tax=unclassified Phaeobacter TaxID=2621772 RepID=UPI000E51F72C|nr:NUDIX domain-containing protein [Phaeobacter sp. LSS9]AXT35181.1 NUDIX domain-containing protein [Phaeobacter sp. LSS9]